MSAIGPHLHAAGSTVAAHLSHFSDRVQSGKWQITGYKSPDGEFVGPTKFALRTAGHDPLPRHLQHILSGQYSHVDWSYVHSAYVNNRVILRRPTAVVVIDVEGFATGYLDQYICAVGICAIDSDGNEILRYRVNIEPDAMYDQQFHEASSEAVKVLGMESSYITNKTWEWFNETPENRAALDSFMSNQLQPSVAWQSIYNTLDTLFQTLSVDFTIEIGTDAPDFDLYIIQSRLQRYVGLQRLVRCWLPGTFFGLADPKNMQKMLSKRVLRDLMQGIPQSTHQPDEDAVGIARRIYRLNTKTRV